MPRQSQRWVKLFLGGFAVTFFLVQALSWIFGDLDLGEISRGILTGSLTVKIIAVLAVLLLVAVVARLVFSVLEELQGQGLSPAERWLTLAGVVLAVVVSIALIIFM